MNAAAVSSNGRRSPLTATSPAPSRVVKEQVDQDQNQDTPSKILRASDFRMNVLELVSLSRRQPENPFVTNRFNKEEVVYYLADGRTMYIPPIAGDLITRLAPDAEQAFLIGKREVKRTSGRGTAINWVVTWPDAEPQRQPAASAVSIASSGSSVPSGSSAPTRQDGPPPIEWGDLPSDPAQQPLPPASSTPAYTTPAPTPASEPCSRRARMADLLTACMEAVNDAIERTKTKLDSAQIQDLVSTLYINESKWDFNPRIVPQTNGQMNGGRR